jgi:pimeloyl-ACP methyl ester carboxylesterase
MSLKLASDTYPGTKTTPVVLLHGGGQTRHAWGATARALSDAGWTTSTYDLRGHGDSEWAPDGDYSIVSFGRDVRRIARDMGTPPVLIGASLGGMSSMAAIAMGAPAAGLVLVDIAHRMEPHGGKRVVEFMGARRDGFASLEEAADAVAAYLPHRERPRDLDGLNRNLREVDGRYHWHWDPALLDMFGSGEAPSNAGDMAAQLLRGLDMPMMLVRGTESDVITEEIADEFEELNPQAEVAAVEGARHMVAGDENTPFTAAVLDFLERRIA